MLCCLCIGDLSAQNGTQSERVAQCFGKIFDAYVKGRLNRLENPIVVVEGTKPLDVLFDHDIDLSAFSCGRKDS